MNKTLEGKGWKNDYSCNCGGSIREHWINSKYPDYEITTRPRKQTFRILSKNHVIVGPLWGIKLEEKMNEYGIGD